MVSSGAAFAVVPARAAALVLLAALLCAPRPGHAEVSGDRFSAGGYFRIMTRPSLQGGEGGLGLWNLYGRLLNEGPWGALELRLDLLEPNPGTKEVWASVHSKIEGGSFQNAERQNGRLDQFRVSQLYVRAGNILLEDVIWQLGTLDIYFGDLGLYDMRPAQIFFDTVGLSARYDSGLLEVLLGVGDSGYFIRGNEYNTILTGGGTVRLRLGSRFEIGGGGQVMFEPRVRGNRFAPYRTPMPANVTYEDFYRGEIVERYLEENPGQEDLFPDPRPTESMSFKLIGYIGFGKLGPLRWNNLFVNFLRRHPENFTTETFAGREYTIYHTEFTDDRYELNVGNEMHVQIIPDLLDAAWGALLGYHYNLDNNVVAGEDNRLFYSTVLRLQLYLSPTFHLLVESSFAQEISNNGNLWREHHDSFFASENGAANSQGLEFGDTDTRSTWQLKAGIVLNPSGFGIYTRPSLRLIWGLQYSNVHNAFGNSFVTSLDQFNEFRETGDRHWHSVIALEAEGWF